MAVSLFLIELLFSKVVTVIYWVYDAFRDNLLFDVCSIDSR